MNNKIEGIIIDAGHGGIDSGAIGNNLQEKDLTLKISKYMYNRLKELGLPVKITRDDDYYLPKKERIKKIKELYNNSPNTLLISNHINAGGRDGQFVTNIIYIRIRYFMFEIEEVFKEDSLSFNELITKYIISTINNEK